MVCENCGQPREGKRTAFCNNWCRCAAGMIRAFRKYLEEDRLHDDDIMMALIQQMRFHNAGITYKDLNRSLTRRQREGILSRDERTCVHPGCGLPATDIDHIDGSSADPANLRSLCHDHHLEVSSGKTETLIALGDVSPDGKLLLRGLGASGVVILGDVLDLQEKFESLYREVSPEVRERIESGAPCRSCDDRTWWQYHWRSVSATGDTSSWIHPPQSPSRQVIQPGLHCDIITMKTSAVPVMLPALRTCEGCGKPGNHLGYGFLPGSRHRFQDQKLLCGECH